MRDALWLGGYFSAYHRLPSGVHQTNRGSMLNNVNAICTHTVSHTDREISVERNVTEVQVIEILI